MKRCSINVRPLLVSVITAILTAVALFGGSEDLLGQERKVLKIGVLGPMSGPAAQWGVELSRGAELRADEINAAGGLKVAGDTYTVQILAFDHKASPAEAITAANKLVFEHKVRYIVGNAIGATTSAAQTITEPNKVLFTFTSYGLRALGPDKPFSFRTDLSDVEMVEPFYRWIRKSQPRIASVAVLSPNDQSGKDTQATIIKNAKALGLRVVAEEFYDREAKDFYPLLTRLLVTKPDLVDVGASPPGSAGLLIKQLYELGYRGAKAWPSGFTGAVPMVRIAGREAAEGTWIPTPGAASPPALRDLSARYQQKYGELPGASAVANYVALDVVTKAMQAAGTIETDKVALQIVQRRFETVQGPLVVGGKETYGIDRQFLRPFAISEVRNGELMDVGDAVPAELVK